MRVVRIFLLLVVIAAFPLAESCPAQAKALAAEDSLRIRLLEHYLHLSDLADLALSGNPTDNSNYRDETSVRAYPQFFVDSYAVRALAVAADLSGRKQYMRACRAWADRMLDYQERMVPRGAYYMNYHRKPGESEGEWFVADCGSIAMAVLAVAVRCDDSASRDKYLASVKSFADLVLGNYVRPSGGVTDGYWHLSDKEWWCSTALYTALALQLHGITGEPRYLAAALAGIDWLLGFEYDGTILYRFEDGAPTTIFYILEAYVSALPYLEQGSERRRKVVEKLSASVEWMADTQNRDGTWDYSPDNWGVKLGGLPCHMLIYLRHCGEDPRAVFPIISTSGYAVSFSRFIEQSAARALGFFSSQGLKKSDKKFTQQDAFTMMSYGELLCPGELYSKKNAAFPFTGGEKR
ncbi:MAG TPA: hypothetical protein VJ417_13205 [Candidatus Glassbacteria bacterium]|nr:hypothetical protein [Candidatus Glassbacteria bacterium]